MTRFDLGEFGKALGGDAGEFTVTKNADGTFQLTTFTPGTDPSDGTDVRPIKEQVRSRIRNDATTTAITRNARGFNTGASLTLSDGSIITEVTERTARGFSTRIYWQGQYITDIIANNDDINGDALIETITRNARGFSTNETCNFGFVVMQLLQLMIDRGRINEILDTADQWTQSRGRRTSTSTLAVVSRGRVIYTGA